MNIFARRDVQKETFTRTVNDFIDFCITQNQKMQQEIIEVLPTNKKNVSLKEFLVITDFQEPDKMIIYGEKDKVQQAVKFFKAKCKVGDLMASTTSGLSNCKNLKGNYALRGMRLFAY